MMSRKTALSGYVAAGVLTLGMVANAHAVQMIDQAFISPANDVFELNSSAFTHFQQGITAGMTGQLSRVDIFSAGASGPGAGVGTPPDKEVVFTVSLGGFPWQDTSDFQTSLYFAANAGPETISIDLSGESLFVTTGQMFAIGLQTSGSNAIIPGFTGSRGSSPYDRGELWFDMPGLSAPMPWPEAATDLNFVTYVGLSMQVPEPSGLILLFAGLSGLLGFAAIRRA